MSKRLLLARIEEQAVTIRDARHLLAEADRCIERWKAKTKEVLQTQQMRAQFAAQVEAVQRERPPDSADLQLAKQIANVARGVLLKLEWSGKVAGSKVACCPICHAAKETGHLRGCTLFQVIGPPRLADNEDDGMSAAGNSTLPAADTPSRNEGCER